MDSNPPKLLVFTDFHPLGKHVGGVCTRALLKDYPAERVFWVGLRSRFDKDWPEEPYTLLTLPRPRQWRGETLARPIRDLFTAAWQVYLARRTAPRFAAQIKAYAIEHDIRTAFVILNADPIMTYTTRELQRIAPSLSVKVLVHDPPTRMCSELFRGLGGALRLYIQSFLRQTVSGCAGLGVCSEGMGEVYLREFGRPSELIIHGLPETLFQTRSTCLTEPNKLIIGFAGSAYPESLWQVLFRELDALGWHIDDRAVEIRYLGHPPHWLENRPQIKLLGWQSQENTLRLLSDCDLCYLPYWFDAIHRESAQQCFPTKLPSYVAAGRPILYHGPVDSSPTVFFNSFKAALVCNDNRAGSLTKCFQEFVRTPGLPTRLAQESQRAAREYLREDLFVDAFERLIRA